MFRIGRSGKSDLTLFALFFLVILAGATVFYRLIEGWSWVNSFYFSSTTLITIGHADLLPSSDFSKLFTVALSFAGVTSFLILITLFVGGILRKEDGLA